MRVWREARSLPLHATASYHAFPIENGKDKILFVVADRSRVVEMWRSEGLVCLQCAPGEF
jgi:hypothetical protein